MKKKLPGICFIGCGNIAARHSKILKKLYPDIRLYFASRDGKKAAEFKRKFNGVESFKSYNEALASKAYDIAFITTPHAFHAELAKKAAENKKDIILEKPAARNLKEFSIIETAVNKNKVRCAIAENYFYKPSIEKIRKYINKGLIGDVLFIEINRTNKSETTGWRSNKEMMGGGALLEGGVHWVNALVSLAGSEPAGVIAFKPEVKYKTSVPFEDTIMVNVNFKNGSVGKLTHSWKIINPLKGISISKIYGTEGLITFETNGLFFSVHGKKKIIRFMNPFNFLGFKAMHRAFIEDYMNGKPWKPGLDIIRTDMNLIESAYKSLKTKKIENLLPAKKR